MCDEVKLHLFGTRKFRFLFDPKKRLVYPMEINGVCLRPTIPVMTYQGFGEVLTVVYRFYRFFIEPGLDDPDFVLPELAVEFQKKVEPIFTSRE